MTTREQVEQGQGDLARSESPTTYEYLRALRVDAGLSIDVVAERAGVTPDWLNHFESGLDTAGVDYETLLRLVRAIQPPRPEWWDEGHEHDLHLPAWAIRQRSRRAAYWKKIEKVRAANREGRHR